MSNYVSYDAYLANCVEQYYNSKELEEYEDEIDTLANMQYDEFKEKQAESYVRGY